MKLTRLLLTIGLLSTVASAQLLGQDSNPTFISRPPDYLTVSEAIAIGAEARVKASRKKNKAIKSIKLGALEWLVIQKMTGQSNPKVGRNAHGVSGIKEEVVITLDRKEWDKVESVLGVVAKKDKRRTER